MFCNRPPQPQIRNLLRPAGAMITVGATRVVCGFFEKRQDFVIAPARVTGFDPAIVTRRLTAQVKQAVDCARSAGYLAPRPLQAALGDTRIGFALVTPIVGRVVHGLEITDRNMRPGIQILAACFKQ